MPIGMIPGPIGGGGDGGATAFTALTDTPADYTDDALKLSQVNAGETGLQFTPYMLPSAAGAVDTALVFDGTNAIAQLQRYVASVSSSDSGSISGATHGLGTHEITWQFLDDDGTDVTPIYAPNVSINKTTFTVTWSTSAAFTGNIILRR